MNMKKIHFTLFADILRSLLVAFRYVVGLGAGQKIKVEEEPKPGYPDVDAEKCIGCKLCAKICPSQAIEVETFVQNDRNPVEFRWIGERCVACGLCVESCPRKALRIKKEKTNVRG